VYEHDDAIPSVLGVDERPLVAVAGHRRADFDVGSSTSARVRVGESNEHELARQIHRNPRAESYAALPATVPWPPATSAQSPVGEMRNSTIDGRSRSVSARRRMLSQSFVRIIMRYSKKRPSPLTR